MKCQVCDENCRETFFRAVHARGKPVATLHRVRQLLDTGTPGPLCWKQISAQVAAENKQRWIKYRADLVAQFGN